MYSSDEIEEIFVKILERITNGESIRSILKDQSMPSTSTFFNWLDKDESKSKRYVRACEIRAEVLFDEMIEIADDSSDDWLINEKTGDEKLNAEHVQRSRLRVDTRKWILSKLNPKKFSERINTDITTDGEKINTIRVFELPDNGRRGDS